MNRALLAVLLTVLLAWPARSTARPAGVPYHPPEAYAPGQVLVLLKAARDVSIDGARPLAATDGRLAAILARRGLDAGRAIYRGRGSRIEAASRLVLLESHRPDFDPVAVARELRTSGLVEAATANYSCRPLATQSLLPNDPYITWAMSDMDSAGVHLPQGWGIHQGNPSVKIGVLDVGVDIGHPDLAPSIWTNPGEIPGNGIDDDHDGYVDDVHGWDFGDDDNDPRPTPLMEFDPEIGDSVDVAWHGSMVAGLAAAATNNGAGVSGAGWGCTILPLKLSDRAGELSTAGLTAAFLYAADAGVSILNVSLGISGDGVAQLLQSLVDQVTASGVLVVAAAGNDGADQLVYPAACSGVLSVGATDETGQRASFSNYGSWVKIAAPGAAVRSTLSQNYPFNDGTLTYLTLVNFIEDPDFVYFDDQTYSVGDGTSFASPIVAGVCGLVKAEHPELGPLAIENRVIATGDAVAFDQPIGPKLNAYRALTEVLAVGPDDPVALTASVRPNPGRGGTSICFTLPDRRLVDVEVIDAAGRRVHTLAHGEFPPGLDTVAWRGDTDARGRAADGMYFAQVSAGAWRKTIKVVLMH